MRNTATFLLKEPVKHASETTSTLRSSKPEPTFIHNLRFIYATENFCLRRYPRIINLIPRGELASQLDNHVSVIMDRLNRLDDIFTELNIPSGGLICSTFKSSIDNVRNLIYSLSSKENHSNADLTSTLLEISIFKSYLYNSLLESVSETYQPAVFVLLKQSLKEEDMFFHLLVKNNQYTNPADAVLNAGVEEY